MMATPLSSPFSLTGDAVIDAATNGYYWQLGADRTIRWSLSNGWSGEYWTNPTAAVQQLSVLFSNISYYANVKFQYAGYFQSPATAATASDINITFDATNITKQFANVSSWAFGDFSNAALNSWYPGAPGDIYVNLNSEAAYLPSYAPGTQGYFLFLHEILHTVGLNIHTTMGELEGPPSNRLDGVDWTTIGLQSCRTTTIRVGTSSAGTPPHQWPSMYWHCNICMGKIRRRMRATRLIAFHSPTPMPRCGMPAETTLST